jgi:hypothetical protein
MLLPRALDICTAGSEIPLPVPKLVALKAKPKLAALDVKKDGKKEPPMARAHSSLSQNRFLRTIPDPLPKTNQERIVRVEK